MRKKRILFGMPGWPNNMTGFLRSHGPLSLMSDVCEIVETPKEDNWFYDYKHWMNIDVCFMHRPLGPYGYAVMEQCKMHKVPLYVDHDDDLLKIPIQNPHRKIHIDEEAKQPCVEWSYLNADILTCSGEVMHEELKNKYKRSDAIHITTGLDDRLLQFKQPFQKNKKIGWRGSHSHVSDLRFYKEPLSRLMKEHKDYNWVFFGIDPNNVGLLGNTTYWPPMNIFNYYQMITKENCSLHFVVLEDTHFNRVKSNLSYLDATLSGSVVICPDFEEFRRPGAILYKNHQEFENMINLAIKGDIDLEKHHNDAWAYIQSELLQSKLNEKRKEILNNL